MDKAEFPEKIFTSLPELLKMEGHARGFSFLAKHQKVRSVLGGKHASKLRGRGMDFEEVRKYVAGDDIRNIDWKVTARTQKTHSKVFSEEKERPVFIVVDQSKSMFFGSQEKMKSVIAAELAALSAFKVQKEGDRVGGLIFTETGADIIFPKRNKKNILRFLERLVFHNHSLKDAVTGNREKLLIEAIQKTQNIVTHDFLVIVISDFIHYSENVIKYLSKLSQHNDILLIKVFDQMERDIPTQKLIFGDGEKQFTVSGDQEETQQKFKQGFDTDLSSFEAQMLKHRIPLIRMNTHQPVNEQLKAVFL